MTREQYCLTYVTAGSKKEAEAISRALVSEKLVACANIFPISSIYRWKGKIETADEHALILKSSKSNFEKITERVKALHSYETPCVIEILITRGSSGYLDWIRECTES